MYNDPILKKIIEILNLYGPKKLKNRWTTGDVLSIPKGAFPRGFVAYSSENISDIAAGMLRDNAEIVLSVVVDATAEFNSPTTRADSHEQVIGAIAGKNADYSFKADSVVGCLRAHQDLDVPQNLFIEVGSETVIEYGLGLEKRGPGVVTAEGVMRFRITHDQPKP